MRHTVRKWFWVWDFQKEEQWLQQMAAKGLALVSVGFARDEFEDSEPGEYDVCLQLLPQQPTHPESAAYLEFLESTGAEHVGSYFRWAYLRKKRAEGGLQLFSDNESRVKHLTHIMALIAPVTAANFVIGAGNLAMLLSWDSSASALSFINLAFGLLGSWGLYKLGKMRAAQKAQAQIFE